MMDGLTGLPANLPNIDRARLPVVYEGAKTALAECSQLDECQQWADKAEALASYARQAQDAELRQMADRIQARAIRRCGELLNQIKSAAGRPQQEIREGTLPNYNRDGVGRVGAAQKAGLSEHQRKTAVRVSRVPDREFENAVERDEPLTVTALADLGRQPRTDHLKGRGPEDFRAATTLLGLLHHVIRAVGSIDLSAAINGLSAAEMTDATDCVRDINGWLHDLDTALGDAAHV